MDHLGRYKLIRKIATGGMAEVFLARAEGPGGFAKTLVIKRILPELAENREFVEMFLAEARVAANLSHTNIVQIFDFGQADDSYFIAMEFADGPNLRSLIHWAQKTEPLPLPLVARIVVQACEGLSYAHEFRDPESGRPMNLVHRDVSTENLVVVRSGSVKVLDFGVARVGGADSVKGTLRGKLSYMPPEQLQGGDIDLRIDVYALGCVLYQLLAHAKPYPQTEDVSLIRAILTEEPTPILSKRPGLPQDLVDAVGRAMARNPEDRYPSCRHFQEDLERYITRTGEHVGTAQLSALVSRYSASGFDTGQGSGSFSISPSGGVSRNTGSAARRFSTESPPPPPADSHAEAKAGSAAAPLAASAPAANRRFATLQIPLAPPPPSAPGATPAGAARPPLPPPETPKPVAAESDDVLFEISVDESPAAGAAPPAAAPAEADEPAYHDALAAAEAAGRLQVLAHRPTRVAPEAIRDGVRSTLAADRSRRILRKFPGVATLLLDATSEVPWQLRESLEGVLDAALLADDHALVLRLLQRTEAERQRFGAWLRAELLSPVRLLSLVERLRAGLPHEAASLKAWLVSLGPQVVGGLMWGIDALEPGPSQDLLCEVLAPLVAGDASAVVAKALAEPPRHLSAWCQVLERAQVKEKAKVFQTILLRRDPAQQMELLTARARAGGADSVSLLVGALSDKNDRVRRHVLKLLGEVGGERVVAALSGQVTGPAMEARDHGERVALWTALAAGGASALPLFAAVLEEKVALFNRKKSVEAKLPAIEALAELRHADARALIERVAADSAQPEEVRAAAAGSRARFDARAAGDFPEEPLPSGERNPWLGRALCLQLLSFARAATVLDLRSELLDGAIERFRRDLRAGQKQEGRIRLVVDAAHVTLNGVTVRYGLPTEALVQEVAQQLQLRDFRGLALDEAISAKELRATLLWLFDPEGAHETVPAGRVLTQSGRTPGPAPVPPAVADPVARSRELYLQLIGLLKGFREELAELRMPSMDAARPALEELSHYCAAGKSGILGVETAANAGSAFAAHAANTALMAMAFAGDLGLEQTELIEIGELALFYTLYQALLPPEVATDPRVAVPEDVRMRAMGMFVAQLRHRRGATYAVAAFEAGLDHAQGPGMLTTLLALADAWDNLLVGNGMPASSAIKAMQGPLSRRFQPDLLGIFCLWAFAQTR